jgi:hypothetical protein
MSDDSPFRLLIIIFIPEFKHGAMGHGTSRHRSFIFHLSQFSPRRLACLPASALHMSSAGGRFGSPKCA